MYLFLGPCSHQAEYAEALTNDFSIGNPFSGYSSIWQHEPILTG